MSDSSQRPKFRLISAVDLVSESGETIAEDLIGRKIAGRYTIQAHLGGGGMADVYRARDDELGIDVAIKMLKPGMASAEMRARMVQEAQAAAQVRHGNLVRVFGTGKLDDTAYIAMELLDGPNLETYLRERPGERLPWTAALDLLLPALEALHAVHARGYVHRDIKPGNIIVTREPGCPPRAVVIDLGLVKPDRALRNAASPPTTEVGRVLCTPGYASPEQAAQHPVDRRSDVYSMAITLYRVLAGRLPFHNARGKPLHVVFAHHVHIDPTLLADVAPGVDIPPEIARVIESALAKDPVDRPQTMLAFAEALQAAAIASTPASRSPFHHWPHGLVLAQLFVLLFAWSMAPTAGIRPGSRGEVKPDPPPVAAKPTTDLSAPMAPRTHSDPPEPRSATSPPTPRPAPVNPEPQPARRNDPVAAARRVLVGRYPAVQACVDHSSGGIEQLRVSARIDIAGRISIHADGAADTPLGRCLDRAFQHTTTSPPLRPLSFVHIYKLKSTPRRP